MFIGMIHKVVNKFKSVGKGIYAVATLTFLVSTLVFCTLFIRSFSQNQRNSQQFPLLASRLFLEKPSDTIINFEPLRQQIQTYLNNTEVNYGFYFEYLYTGTSIAIGDNNQFVGASLMKIPIVMDLYKAAELGKLSLDKKVTVPDDIINSNDELYGNIANFKAGQQISLRELAKVALADSDNTAAFTIFDATKDLLEPADQALNNLDIEMENTNSSAGPVALISAYSYTSILKCLYFSCFLNYDNSQAILNHLTQGSTDDSRIRAGVPELVQVARKIGSFSNITQSDCGIVYIPSRRYSLCIMLNEDPVTADRHIRDVSKMVYEYVLGANSSKQSPATAN
jgi:beta-lactamase class A